MQRSPRTGTVIVLVLVVIAILTLAALTFSELMLSERRGADFSVRKTQVRLFAESGIEAVRMALLLDGDDKEDFGEFYDNPDQFCGVLVTDSLTDPRDVGRFSVLAPGLDEDGLFSDVRYGLLDESSKWNLRLVMEYETLQPGTGRTLLTGLPGVDETIADAVLDWLDEDDEPREYGYEHDYYESLDRPYSPRNGMVASIEELLLVEGVTPGLLYGADWNQNGMIDLAEPDGETIDEDYDNSDHRLDCGLISLLTIDSKEADTDSAVTSSGTGSTSRVYVNADDLTSLQSELNTALGNESYVNYILAYRLFGTTGILADSEETATLPSSQGNTASSPPSSSQSSGSGQQNQQTGNNQEGEQNGTASNQLDLSQTPKARINSPFDLIGGALQVQYSGQTATATLPSPFTEDLESMAGYLPTLIQTLKFSENAASARININEASRGVLQAIPGMTDDALEAVLTNRLPDPIDAEETEEMATYAWPILLELVDLDTMKKIGPFLSQPGTVKSAQIVGRFDSRSPVARLKVLFDTSEQPAKILRVTDLSDLGPGYSPDLLGVYEDSPSIFSTGIAVTENR
ncbi:MAG: general secretion pathway protein GspK [Planctomycetaceae bacterium]|nr:general secretion pathway protein GspK [Planctomycetaceae bacterium]